MGSDKTFVFTPEGGNSGGSKFDIMALLPGLMGNKGLDPNILALMGNKNNGEAYGGGWWGIIWLIVIAAMFGWNRGGNGGLFGGNGGGSLPAALPAELTGNAGRELLMSAIQGNGAAINQLASSFGCSMQQVQTGLCSVQNLIQGVGNQVGMSSQEIINAIQSGNNSVLTQIANCCCNTQQAIERNAAASQLQNCQNLNTLTNTMNSNTLALRDGSTNNTNAILAKLDAIETRALQDKLDAKNNQILALTNQLSQEHQNAYFGQVVAQATTPINAALAGLKSEIDGIKCKLPPTVAVPYPQLQAFNPECFRAAAYGAFAGDMAANYAASPYCGC